ncbi:MAG: glycogen/starch/alpha-glucan phosphorylase [Spirochaetales bacterium]|uniref:Alpha-1,4 glucan phosphorylase n=1 Tax=Candidatus Thalassospirochaeta sargassi TaxID=3119039 RepID=A0AAJ1MP22_9SPIO|nr:glycogen/starch/alpha-glucan phosphorylase [Spirochaetales bacterium]
MELTKKGNSKEELKKSFLEHLKYSLAVTLESSHSTDKYIALAQTIRDRITERWFETKKAHEDVKAKTINYFSFEFLMGRAMSNNMINLGIKNEIDEMLEEEGIKWEEIKSAMVDSGLGNGGLGRLAACFLDSLATLEIPAYGYGLRYRYGFFKQAIINGYQVEEADDWLKFKNPWEIRRNDIQVTVQFGGRVARNKKGRSFWVDTNDIIGVPYDTPIVGYGGNTVNTLRLWDSKSAEQFDYQAFNEGDYYNSVDEEVLAETLTKVLYPNDAIYSGKELRFRQQFFFVSASLQDTFRRFKRFNLPVEEFPNKMAVQLNDTHPAIAVAELMRLLVDIEEIDWDTAWDITNKTLGYTNHTLMPEALETWPVSMFMKFLPRHLEIIYQINHFFLQKVTGLYPGDMYKLSNLSLISEEGEKRVRMAPLAILGSHSVNGVAELHSRLVKEKLVPDFYEMFPDRFNNKTNGITQRRWLLKSNPALAGLINETIGESWITDLSQLKKLEKYADDSSFLDKLHQVKRDNKVIFSNYCMYKWDFKIDPDTVFDVQVKRIHEYKRQLLNVLHIISLYNSVRNGEDIQPRTFIFSGKAAPGYEAAKLIIKLINNVSQVINGDKSIKDKIKIYFLPNYSVSLAERIFPASEVSEQISTAGTEASGTGNMKFMLNGALTVGTLDGANIEILEEAGDDNMFIFGLKTEEVESIRHSYNPKDYLGDENISSIFRLLSSGYFNISEPDIFDPLVNNLLEHDYYMHLADLSSYIDIQKQIGLKYSDKTSWMRSSLMNIAGSGKFSSDRTIREYAEEIWDIKTCHVKK